MSSPSQRQTADVALKFLREGVSTPDPERRRYAFARFFGYAEEIQKAALTIAHAVGEALHIKPRPCCRKKWHG